VQVRQTRAVTPRKIIRLGRKALKVTRRHMLPPDRSGVMMSFAQGRLRYEPGVEDHQLPDDAKKELMAPKRVRALLRQGYKVQRMHDSSITYWKPQDGQSTAETPGSRGRIRRVQQGLHLKPTAKQSSGIEVPDNHSAASGGVQARSTAPTQDSR
jgi:hypothetical protein